MSKFLAVDCSSAYLAVAAVNGAKRCVKYLPDCGMRHSVEVMGQVDAALRDVNLAPAECDFMVAVTGPGSFTGIRIGISAVKGLAMGAGVPARGVTSFDLVAYNVNSKNFYVVIDAGRSHYYVQGYGDMACPPLYTDLNVVCSLGAPLYGFEELDLPQYTRLDAGSCLICAAQNSKEGAPEALYVRKPQAEENKK